MPKLDKKLRANGWPEHEIKRVHSVISKESNREFGVGLNRILFMTILIVITLCMVGVAIFLIPFLIVISNYYLYFIVVALGIVFGLLFNFIIQDIEHLEPKHHIFAGIFIPLIGIFAMTISVYVANRADEILRVSLRHNPWIVSAIFVLVFMIPFLISSIKKKSL